MTLNRHALLIAAMVLCGCGTSDAYAARVRVRTDPVVENASVYVDAKLVGRTGPDGTLLIGGLSPGVSVRIGAEHLPSRRLSELEQIRPSRSLVSQVRLRMVPKQTVLVLSTLQQDVRVAIGGRQIGLLKPGEEVPYEVVPERQVTVTAQKAGHEIWSRIYKPKLGQRIPIQLDLRPVVQIPATQTVTQDPIRQTGSGRDVLLIVLSVLLGLVVAALGGVAIFGFRANRLPKASTQHFDRYQIEYALGRGGMATVYKGRDLSLPGQPVVALKILNDGLTEDQDLVRKFLREGEILEQISRSDPESPVVRVMNYGISDTTRRRPFMALEYLSGESLLDLVRRRRRFSSADAIAIVDGVARALEPAHALGIYHRDITPDNIIMAKEYRGGTKIRLIDFGVARHEFAAHGTLDGSITGKPPYMSPEQCAGTVVDARTDVYSLGILLYTLLVGEPPFSSSNPLEVMRMHREEEVVVPGAVENGIKDLLSSMLSKNRDERPTTATEVRDRIRGLSVS